MRSEPARDNAPLRGRVPTGTCFSFFLLLIRGNTFIRLPRHFPPARFISCEHCQGWKAPGELGGLLRAGLCSLLPPRQQCEPGRDSTQPSPWFPRERSGGQDSRISHRWHETCPLLCVPSLIPPPWHLFFQPQPEAKQQGIMASLSTVPCWGCCHPSLSSCPPIPVLVSPLSPSSCPSPPSCPGQFALSTGTLHPRLAAETP